MAVHKGKLLGFNLVENPSIDSDSMFITPAGCLNYPQNAAMSAMAKNLDSQIMSGYKKPVWDITHPTGHCNHPVVDALKIEKNMMDLSFLIRMHTIWGTILDFKMPSQLTGFTSNLSLSSEDIDGMIEMGTRLGSISLDSGSKALENGTQMKVFIGGSRNGEYTHAAINPFKVVVLEPMSMVPVFDSFEAQKASCDFELYWLENVGIMVNSLPVTATVYRHSSVPVEALAEMLMAELEEFPHLRLMPNYFLFWWMKK